MNFKISKQGLRFRNFFLVFFIFFCSATWADTYYFEDWSDKVFYTNQSTATVVFSGSIDDGNGGIYEVRREHLNVLGYESDIGNIHNPSVFNSASNTTSSVEYLSEGKNVFYLKHYYWNYDDTDTLFYDSADIAKFTVIAGPQSNDIGMSMSVQDGANGTASIYMSADHLFDRPIVILQGYKPRDHVGSFDEWYNDINTRDGDFMLDRLRSQGYDVVLYRYRDVNAGVASATAGLEVLLKRFNDNDLSRIRSVSLFGQSMGGVVARYTLLHLATLGIKTKVTTWISYDSPHLGALVPPTLVDNLNRINDKLDVIGCGSISACSNARSIIRNYINDMNSGTASELLLNAPKNANNRNILNAQISNMGSFPKIPSLGIANGTLNIRQDNPESSILLTTFDIYRPWPYKNADIDLWSTPSVENQPGGYENFYSTFNEKVIELSAGLRQVELRSQKHVFVTTSSAIGNLPFTKVITADSNSINEAHLQITKPKSDAIISWLNSYQL